jgi:hypothetical protein
MFNKCDNPAIIGMHLQIELYFWLDFFYLINVIGRKLI